MKTQIIFKSGNSEVVAIPQEIREKLNIKKGSKVTLELGADQKTLIISKAGHSKELSSITPEFIKVLKVANKRYGSVLAKLAKL